MNRTRILLLSAVTLALLGGGLLTWKLTSSSSKETYREVKIERGNLLNTVTATGTVQPENRLEIKPPIAGRVEQVLVKEGQQIRKGQILAWMSSTERAAMLDAARSKGDAELKRWEQLYRPTPVLAPINGMLILRSIESGQSFTNTDAILVMSDRLTVKAQVDETDISQIKLKQKAEIVLDAYASEKIPATVDQIAFDAKTVNNVTTYVVDVLPNHTPDFMRSGMTANVAFTLDSRKDVLLIPNEAISTDGGKSAAWFKDGKDKALRELKLGLSDGRQTEILSGAKEGDTLLVRQMILGDKKTRSTSPFSPAMGGGGRRR